MQDKVMQELKTIDWLRDNPMVLLERQELSRDDTVTVLEHWRQQMLDLQTATEENMASVGNESARAAEQLRAVNEALRAAQVRT